MQITKPDKKDLEAMLDIYNYEVEHGVATFDLYPKSMEAWEDWFAAHNVDNHPLLIARIDGEVAGYASLSAYRERAAYSGTVELSVYISPAFRGCGVATALMERILQDAREDERTHAVVSVITTGNEVSAHLHQKFGFTFCGTLPEVGKKFGRYLGVDHYLLKV